MRAGGEAALQQLTGAATAPKPTPDGPPEAGPESEPLDVKAPPAPETAAVATDALAKRDEAVAAVDAREGDAGGAALASTPVQFAPVAIEGATAEETAAAEQQRAQAAAMVSEFLGTVATKSDEAAAAGAQVPGRMKAAASASVDAIAGSVEEHTAEIAGRVARLRAQVQGKAAAARGTVAGRHAATTNAVRAATSASRETIGTAYATSLKTIDDLVTAQLRTVDDRYRDGDKRFRDAGKKVGGEAAARGSEMAADYMRGLRDVDDSFLDGPLTYRKGEARANAAREVSKAYDKGLQEEADKQADEAVKGKPHDVESVQTTARQAREALKAQHTAILTTLADAEASALRQADEARTRLNASIAQALAGAEQTLAGQEASLVDNLRATARTQSAAVEQQATEVAGALQGQVDKAVGGLRETGAALAAQAQGQVAPPLDELAGSLSAASAQLDGAVGELRAGLERGQGGAEQQLAEAVSTVSGGLASSSQTGLEGAANTASEVGTSIGAIGASAASTFGGILSSHQQTTAQTATSATEGFKGATDGVKKSYEAMSTGLQAGFEKNAKGLEDGLRGALPKMETEIRTQADEAASHVAPRWKSIVKWVLIIAVIVVVALVIGPFVIGAVGAALGTGAIMTGIIAGAIVGAATSATIQVINNWAENRPLGEGVMRAAIVGAIGGAVGGGFGAYFAGLGQAGNAVANTAFRQFALNTVTGVATENIINLATGQWSWESFGMSLLTNIAIGGAMHVASGAKPIAGIQERSMGAGQRFGGSIRATVTGVGPINVQPGEPVPSGRAGTPEEPVPGGRAATPEEPVPGGRAGTPEEPVPGGRTGTPEEPVPGGRTGTPEEPVPGGRPTTEEPGARPATAEGGEPVAGGKPGATEAETPVKVGDTPHEVKLRNGPDGPEVWACSQVCGPLKGKIDDMLPHVEDPKVRAELELLKAKAGQLEADIAAGKYPEPGDRLAAVRDLGDQLKAIGVVEPKVGVLLEGGPDFGKLGVEVGEPIVIKPSEAGSLDLPEGSKVLYVVRDKNTGQILKVGETTAGGPLEARFDRYRLAGERLNVDVEIEVRPVTLPEGQGIRGPEQLLRDQVDIGTSLPWDNTVLEGLGPRLGRGGPGTPFEPLPGGSRLREEGWYWNEKGELVPPGGGPPPAFRRSNAPPPENEVRDILAKAGGKVTKAADDAGVSVQTIYNWMKRYGLKAGDFK
jgi:hypothetical protein